MTDGLPPEILEPDMNEQGNIIVPKVTRAEWIAAIALLVNVMTIAFVAGQVMQTQNDQSRRIDQLEETDRSLVPRAERTAVPGKWKVWRDGPRVIVEVLA
ncbi:MAG: hypothetical protein U0975_08805 [Erythrobacter sp.]|nr:hypothetical protein [Erythrobacter sp.]MDZ4272757.1 hypothetical protein [Erythrobacter sp.]